MARGAKLRLEGAVRAGANYAAFAFSALMDPSGEKRIEVIDTFRFDNQGKVVEMRAFWGPETRMGSKRPERRPGQIRVRSGDSCLSVTIYAFPAGFDDHEAGCGLRKAAGGPGPRAQNTTRQGGAKRF